jgi:glycerol uptake facilitator-like aquaporin
MGERQRPAPPPPEPPRPLAVTGVALGAVSLLLLVFSLGAAFFGSAVLALLGMAAGRRSHARVAVTVGIVGLALAFVAGVAWMILDANGVSPADLESALRRHR